MGHRSMCQIASLADELCASKALPTEDNDRRIMTADYLVLYSKQANS